MLVKSLFLFGVFAQSIYNFAVIVFAAADILRRAHNGNVYLPAPCPNMVPVDKINVGKLAGIKLSVLNGNCFASAETGRKCRRYSCSYRRR